MTEIGGDGPFHDNPGRHRALTSGFKTADVLDTRERTDEYKKQYIAAIDAVTAEKESPFIPVVAKRAQMLRGIHIEVNKARANYFDPEEGIIYVNSLDPVTRGHESMHPLLFPGFDWDLWNEGFVNIAAGFVHKKIGLPNSGKHAATTPELNYKPNEELLEQYMRITGISFRRIVEIGTHPVGQYENLTQIINSNPTLISAQRRANMDFFNIPVIVGGRTERIIDYGRRIEDNEKNARITPGQLISEIDLQNKHDAIRSTVVEAFKEIEPIAA